MAVSRKIIGYQYGAPVYDSLPDAVVSGGVAGFAQPVVGGDRSQSAGVAGVGVAKAKTPAGKRYAPRITMNLPGVGGPASVAEVVATNAAAAQAAAAAAPFTPKKTKKAAPKTTPATGSGTGGTAATTVAPAAAAPAATSDGTYDWWHSPSYYEDQARSSLSGDIQSTRDQYDRQQEALKAQQAGAAKLLSDFGKSVSKYYSDATGRAGQGFDTRAAAQTLLGALGQRAFTGQSDQGIAANLAAAGNGQLGHALASQDVSRNATVGAILNRIVGTDPARTALAESKTATSNALSNLAAQNKYSQRLLSGLSVQQQNALGELLGKRADFETKLPSIISQRALEMQSAAAKNVLAQQAFGLKVDTQKSNEAYRAAVLDQNERKIAQAGAKASSLSPSRELELKQKAASVARDLGEGRSTQTTDATGKVKSVSWTKTPTQNYQQALKALAAAAPGLSLEYYSALLSQFPKWATPGQNGRPFLDANTRQRLVDAGYAEADVYAAAFDAKKAAAFASAVQGLG